MGGAAPTVSDSGILLSSLHAQLRRSLDALSAQLDATGEQSEESDAARDGRKVSAAVQQTLDRLPPAAELAVAAGAARTLIAAAAEDCAWAWRMIQAPATSPALVAAARVLADHATGCCERAGALLNTPLSGEPGDGA